MRTIELFLISHRRWEWYSAIEFELITSMRIVVGRNGGPLRWTSSATFESYFLPIQCLHISQILGDDEVRLLGS